MLDLHPLPKEGAWDVRPLPVDEIEGLAGLFLAAHRNSQPFTSLDEKAARAAAHDCPRRTRSGEDGPLAPGSGSSRG